MHLHIIGFGNNISGITRNVRILVFFFGKHFRSQFSVVIPADRDKLSIGFGFNLLRQFLRFLLCQLLCFLLCQLFRLISVIFVRICLGIHINVFMRIIGRICVCRFVRHTRGIISEISFAEHLAECDHGIRIKEIGEKNKITFVFFVRFVIIVILRRPVCDHVPERKQLHFTVLGDLILQTEPLTVYSHRTGIICVIPVKLVDDVIYGLARLKSFHLAVNCYSDHFSDSPRCFLV